MKKILSLLGFLLFVPWVAGAIDVYDATDAKDIYMIKLSDGSYSLAVQLRSGRLFEVDPVRFTTSRYQFFEDAADSLNEHRSLTQFDDEDIRDMLRTPAPFNAEDIADLDVTFPEEQKMIITILFKTGDKKVIEKQTGQNFSSSVEVASYVTPIVNAIPEFEGKVTPTGVLNSVESFAGVVYYAPDIVSIIAEYDRETNKYSVSAEMSNGDIKKFSVDFKDRKSLTRQDIADAINYLYVEYEDANISADEVAEKIEWKSTPILVDDITKISISKMDDTHIWIVTRSDNYDGTETKISLIASYDGDFKDGEVLALITADALEKNPLFAPDFSILDLYDLIYVITDSTGDVVLDGDRYQETEIPEELRQEVAIENPVQDNESAETASTTEATTSVASTTDVTSTSAGDSVDAQDNQMTDGDTQSGQDENGLSEEDIIKMLIALILQYVAENGIDVDLSGIAQ